MLATKQDQLGALSAAEVEQRLQFESWLLQHSPTCRGYSTVRRVGLKLGLEGLYEMILRRKKAAQASEKRW